MNVKKAVGILMIAAIAAFGKTISLDTDKVIRVHLKNNSINILRMPFVVQNASLATKFPKVFKVRVKNRSVVIAPSVSSRNAIKATGDLLIFSMKGNSYLIKIDALGNSQIFEFTTNREEAYIPPQAKVFETGKIERDVKKLIKTVINKKEIPGYKKIKVGRLFDTPDLLLQKQTMYDGGKYRVEEWFVKNKTQDILTLDYENFYTNGILAIAFEKSTLKPGEITKMWMIVDKATVVDRLKRMAR